MPAYLIRHANAGSRSAFHGDDLARPLSKAGKKQATDIAKRLSREPIGYVGSSPATRCIQTVKPLAKLTGQKVHVRPRLAEGADVSSAHRLLVALESENPALCAHGDLIPALVQRLIDGGMVTTHGPATRKGAIWIIEFADGAAVSGTYLPPR